MNYTLKPANVLLFLVIALLIAPTPGILFGPLSIRLIDLSILFISFIFLMYFILKGSQSIKTWTFTLLKDKAILFILLASLSVVVSTIIGSFTFPEETSLTDVYELYRYVFYFVFYTFAAYLVLNPDKMIIKFSKLLYIIVIFIQIFGILQFYNIFNINHNFGLLYTQSEHFHNMVVTQQRITSTFANPNVYGAFLIIVLSILLAMFFIKKQKFNWWVFFGIILTLFSIVITTSRTTLITTFGLIVYIGITQVIIRIATFKQVIMKLFSVLAVFVVVVAILVPQIHYLNSAFNSVVDSLKAPPVEQQEPLKPNNNNNQNQNQGTGKTKNIELEKMEESLKTVESFNLRYHFWNVNLAYFYDSPIVGAGPLKNGIEFADNSYIYILARYGIVGALIYVLFLGYVYFKTFTITIKKKVSENKLIIASALQYIIVAYAVMGITLESWFNVDSMVIFFVLLGLLKNKQSQKH